MSVSVFSLSQHVQWTLQTILQLRRCYPTIRSNVTFSVVTPLYSSQVFAAASQHLSAVVGSGGNSGMLSPLSRKKNDNNSELSLPRDQWKTVEEESANKRGDSDYNHSHMRSIKTVDDSISEGWGDIGDREFSVNNFSSLPKPLATENFLRKVEHSLRYSRRKRNFKNRMNHFNMQHNRMLLFEDLGVDIRKNDKQTHSIYKHLGGGLPYGYSSYRYINKGSGVKPLPISDYTNDCSSLQHSFGDLSSSANSTTGVFESLNYDLKGVEYPNNLLRNLALQASNTKYVLVLDIDMLPSLGLYQNFLRFANNRGIADTSDARRPYEPPDDVDHLVKPNKEIRFQANQISLIPDENVVFVLPTYEVLEEEMLMPLNMRDLLDLIKRGYARPFYVGLCKKCQVRISGNSHYI